jgi:hypothetical protein
MVITMAVTKTYSNISTDNNNNNSNNTGQPSSINYLSFYVDTLITCCGIFWTPALNALVTLASVRKYRRVLHQFITLQCCGGPGTATTAETRAIGRSGVRTTTHRWQAAAAVDTMTFWTCFFVALNRIVCGKLYINTYSYIFESWRKSNCQCFFSIPLSFFSILFIFLILRC